MVEIQRSEVLTHSKRHCHGRSVDGKNMMCLNIGMMIESVVEALRYSLFVSPEVNSMLSIGIS